MSSFILPYSYIMLDLETNGLPKKDGDLSEVDATELGYIEIEEGQETNSVSVLCKPIDENGILIPQTKKIIEITHITDDMLEVADPVIEVMEKSLPHILHSDKLIAGSNVIKFDRLFIDKYCDVLGWDRVEKWRWVDTAALFKTYRRAHVNGHENWSLPGNQTQFFDWAMNTLSYSWKEDKVLFNVDAAIRYLGIPLWGIEGLRHRAVYDCRIQHLIYMRLKEVMDI